LVKCAGCSYSGRPANSQHTENLLSAASFRTIVANTPQRQEQLKALPPNKVTLVQRNRKNSLARGVLWRSPPRPQKPCWPPSFPWMTSQTYIFFLSPAHALVLDQCCPAHRHRQQLGSRHRWQGARSGIGDKRPAQRNTMRIGQNPAIAHPFTIDGLIWL
jgi:hypothetical protein